MKELVVLVADNDMEQTIRSLLDNRLPSIGIHRSLEYEIFRHPQRDSGCYQGAHDVLRNYIDKCRNALVVFDKHGCGQDDSNTQQLENEVRTRLSINGWPDNAEVIIIEPELENWVWSKSSELPQILGWKQNLPLFDYLEQNYEISSGKPLHPKETLQEILKKNGKPFSSSIHKAVAEKVSLERCEDEAFVRLKNTLRGWFVEDHG